MEGSGTQAVLFHFDPIRAEFLLSSCCGESFSAPVHQKTLKITGFFTNANKQTNIQHTNKMLQLQICAALFHVSLNLAEDLPL